MTTTAPEAKEATACCGTDCCDDTVATETAPLVQNEDIKATVREKYAQIATGATSGCCETTCCGDSALDISMVGDAYEGVEGYVADADLSLGCGLPTEYANLQPGQTVLDLGSGAGLDAFVARRIVGETGQVLGVDMTPEMIAKARDNAEKLGYDNVTFHQGDIEALPLDEATVDVVISNCVLNLVPDKQAAFAEMHRVLRPGGHFCVSDIVYEGEMPEAVKRSAELYVGCVAGAMERTEYLDTLRAAGFVNVRVVKEKRIDIPEKALRPEEHEALRTLGSKVQSITVYGERI